jgi:tetratricopeptide (TPR) repeat protein
MAVARHAGWFGALVLAALVALVPAQAADAAGKVPKPPRKPTGGTPELNWSEVGSTRYDACVKDALNKPSLGFERAIAWRDEGGGSPARHCVAVALYALGDYAEAAKRLEELAQEAAPLTKALRRALLGQAGEAWMAENDYARAKAVFDAALRLAPDDVDLLLQRSLALAWAENYFEALDDLNRIIELEPDHADALAFRATAYRYVGSLELAADDVERALKVVPDHLGALLERGILVQLKGDATSARADWMKVIGLAPESPAADAARGNLERLDVRTE